MELFLLNTASGLVPQYDSDYEEKKKLTIGKTYKAKITVPRNIKYHRKYFALLNLTLQNQDKYDTIDSLLIEIKLKTGHYELHVTTKGKPVYIPKSIAFNKMDEFAFQDFYSKSLDVVLKYFLTGMTPEQIENEVLNFM